jgi:hypothetical protein
MTTHNFQQKQVIVLAKFIDVPVLIRFNYLLKSVSGIQRSELPKILESLEKLGYILRKEHNRKDVKYCLNTDALAKQTKLMDAAKYLSILGSYESIKDVMDFIIENEASFASKCEAIQIAFNFWMYQYSSLCSFISMMAFIGKEDSSVLTFRFYQSRIEYMIKLMIRFKKQHPEIDLIAKEEMQKCYVWRDSQSISQNFSHFLQHYNAPTLDISALQTKLREKEKLFQEKIICIKNGKNKPHTLPQWLCSKESCKYFSQARRAKNAIEYHNTNRCMFKVIRTRDMIHYRYLGE